MATKSPSFDNKKAYFNYFIDEEFEAGIVLLGSEVKSIRNGHAMIAEAYVSVEEGRVWLVNATIEPYSMSRDGGHEPRRRRALLLHRREADKIAGRLKLDRLTAVPLRMYFNDKGRIKLKIGLARGKKDHDKRQTEKDRDWSRQKARRDFD